MADQNQDNQKLSHSLILHQFYSGKMETVPKCEISKHADFSTWYSPGVAEPCLAIKEQPDLVYDYTNKGNTVAIISDGSRILGLGDIGPKAGLPVMEGKAMLFKHLGGVDAVSLMLDTKDPQEIISMVLALQPSFGGINLEDISQPKCFRVLEALQARAEIPVWHDDQQGTATVILAGIISALRLVGKSIDEISIAFIGCGAANVASSRLLFARGVNPQRCYITDINGILGRHRHDILDKAGQLPEQAMLCLKTNGENRLGGNQEAIAGCDVVISLSQPGPGTIKPAWIRSMAKDAIVFACANPIPEIWPHEALEAGAALVATGRSDFPNQVNNSLIFPGLFRGVLDVQARSISDEMCFAAADTLAGWELSKRSREAILPSMDDWEVVPSLAAAVGLKAIEQGLARKTYTRTELEQRARDAIIRSRGLTKAMMEQGFIAPAPTME